MSPRVWLTNTAGTEQPRTYVLSLSAALSQGVRTHVSQLHPSKFLSFNFNILSTQITLEKKYIGVRAAESKDGAKPEETAGI